jgi:hypothetical protein
MTGKFKSKITTNYVISHRYLIDQALVKFKGYENIYSGSQ